MEGMKHQSILACLALLGLSSCLPDNKQSLESSGISSANIPSFSDSSVPEDTFSYDDYLSSGHSSSSLAVSSERTVSSLRSGESTDSSSSLMTSSLTDSSIEDQEYCSVSLYQSNMTRDHVHEKGDVRLDKTIRIKVGDPLYSDSDGLHDFYFSLSPVITQHGDGAYSIVYLFVDEDCTQFYRSGTPVFSDSSFYYYCQG